MGQVAWGGTARSDVCCRLYDVRLFEELVEHSTKRPQPTLVSASFVVFSTFFLVLLVAPKDRL